MIGRLFPGAPAERVEVQLGQLKPYLVEGIARQRGSFFLLPSGNRSDSNRRGRDFRFSIASPGAGRQHSHPATRAHVSWSVTSARLSRKFKELAVAAVLEIRLRKDEILERYINDVPMGEYEGTPIDGMPQAARYFFNKDLSEVTPAEAATLIGMIQAPTLYDPRRHPDTCRKRRDVVLGVMKQRGRDRRRHLRSRASRRRFKSPSRRDCGARHISPTT